MFWSINDVDCPNILPYSIDVNGISKKTIHKAFQKAIRIHKNKKKTLKSPFGDGNASLKIVKKLENLSLDKDLIQKELMYWYVK